MTDNVLENAVGGEPLSKRFRFGWVLEILLILSAGALHDWWRNVVTGATSVALSNAKDLVVVEGWLGVYHEQAVQQFFLEWPVLAAFWNLYYDTAHFVVPAVVAVVLYVRYPRRFVRMRNTFLIMLFVTAPLAWLAYPVTPPKYMPKSYGYVNTQVEYWNVGPQRPISYGEDGEPTGDFIAAVGNPYASMPSHHASWALWCVLALWPVVRRRWVKALLLAYPLLTLTAIVATANHWIIDFAAGAVDLAIAYALALLLERVLRRRRDRRALGARRAQPAGDDGTRTHDSLVVKR